MSNSRDLLKEAIADAKSVKEAAIANAKAALEEAFTPYLQEKFAAKLAEIEMEEEEDVTEEMTDENYGEDGPMEERMSNPIQRKRDDEMKNGKFSRESAPEIETEKDRYKGIDGDEDELNLEELLAELDEEMEKTEGMEKKDDLMEAEDQEEEYVGDDERYEFEKGKEAGEDEEIDLEDMSEEDLKSLIEDVIADMVAAGELEAGDNFEDEEEGDEEEIDIDMEDEEEEEITERKKEGYDDREDESVSARRGKEADKKQSFKARRDDSYGKFGKRDAEAAGKASGPGTNKINKENLNEEEVNEVDAGTIADLTSMIMQNPEASIAAIAAAIPGLAAAGAGVEKLVKALSGKKATSNAEVEEMQDQIEELASTLSEVKLLNAKLLYTNKIFRAKNLNESQKVKVLEAFDKAASVKDAKLIYETLTTIKETKSPVTESMRGMASKAVGVAPEKKPILEVNDQFARWKVLAGIKK
jgi:hypothetical protein